MQDFSIHLCDGRLQVNIALPVFDARTVPQFKQALAPWSGRCTNAVDVDIRCVKVIDSSALSALLWLCQATGRKRIALQGASAQVRSIVELTRLQRVFALEAPAIA